MGKERILVLVVALALGAGVWLAMQGAREGRKGSAGLADAGESTTSQALAALPFAPEPRREEGAIGPSAETEEQDDRPGMLALRLVARETKEPLSGVHVRLMAGGHEEGTVFIAGSRGDESRSPCSDADGRVELEARAGQGYSLQVDPLGKFHVRAEKFEVSPLEPGQRLETEIGLTTRDDLRWFGRVVDDAGTPLPGARVDWIETWPSGAPLPSVSGVDGVLALGFASWRESTVRVVHEGYREALVLLRRGHETPEQAQSVSLLRPARLDVRVRDEGGVPLAGLEVELRFGLAQVGVASSDSNEYEMHQGRTDADGTFALGGLPPRVDCQVVVRREGEPSRRQRLRLEPGEVRELVFEFGNTCSLRGRVQDEEGTPAPGLDLWRLAGTDVPGYLEAEHESAVVDKARTDAEGRFTFASVPPGEWWLGVAPHERRGHPCIPLTLRVLVAPEDRLRELLLVCPPAQYIRGRVLAESGGPVQALVTATRQDLLVRVQSDSSGRFSLGPLPAGEWILEASPSTDPGFDWISAPRQPAGTKDLESAGRETALRAPSERVRAFAGDSDIVLRLQAGGGLWGVVLDQAGVRVVHAEVEARREEDGSIRSAGCNENGAFRFVGLPPGHYRVLARADESVAVLGPERVEPGAWNDGLELRLVPGATLRLRLTGDSERRCYRLAWNGVPWLRGTLAGGTEAREVLPAGQIRCELLDGPATDASLVEARDAVLRAGEETVLVFELAPVRAAR